ncbi:MAG: nucleoside-diphosphate sugar epimerase/dehydratase, partial [Eubacteriales bacterium]|nr:nucleoside-diphosphate sugar epimerase/dehydratase [Eubacteriales bacterium]
MSKISKIIIIFLGDIICINIAYIVAFLLRFEFNIGNSMFCDYFTIYMNSIIWITLLKLVVFYAFGLYNSLWRYAGTEELVKVFLASVCALSAVMAYLYFTQQTIPRGIQLIAFLLDIIFIGGTRLGYRSLRNLHRLGKFDILHRKKLQTKVLLIGAGDAGASMIKEIRRNPKTGKDVVAVIDDNPEKIGKRIVGKKIVGNRWAIKKAVKRYRIDEIIIAIPSAGKNQTQEIIAECQKTKCRLKILPAYIDLIDGRVSVKKLRDVNIEDLLGREPVSVNIKAISNYIEGKIVLVTGGGGSIGSELCRQIAKFSPRKLIALDIYENSIFELVHEIKTNHPDLKFETVIASVRDKERLGEIFGKYHPHVVFHAAAHKHVPLMEKNPKEAVLNNIIGTKNIIDLSHDYVVEKFVLISTDKAVNPTNVMGATKRVAEMLMQEKSYKSLTSFSAVRFGNVLDSNGSVLPLFRRQIERGGPVTVTHENITRYFMTIPEAVQLVVQAGAMAEGGEIFILDMGNAVKIIDLAEKVIRLSGYEPHVDIEISVIGLRPGEKLYEELLL